MSILRHTIHKTAYLFFLSVFQSGFPNDAHKFFSKRSQLFKLDWVIMSIVILCIVAMGLYALINQIEKIYLKRI